MTGNVLDYLDWRGDLPFTASGFCEVDNLLFSMLSFVDFTGIVPSDGLAGPVRLDRCYEAFHEKYPEGQEYGAIIPNENNDLFRKAARSERFREVYLACYRNEVDEAAGKQFAAVTFLLPDKSIFIAFRGTDDTLVGWREDFQLSFTCPVPSQQCAVDYVEDICRLYTGPVRFGGHSKGGNLSAYAAAFSSAAVRDRLLIAYSNDGPGFTEDVVSSEAYRSMAAAGKIVVLMPQSSIVGMLLEHNGPYRVIRSTQSTLLQHDPYSWQIMGREFVTLPDFSPEGKRNAARIKGWVRSMTPENRRKFTDLFFRGLEAGNARTVSDLTEDAMKSITAALRTWREFTPEERNEMQYFLKLYWNAGRRNAGERGDTGERGGTAVSHE